MQPLTHVAAAMAIVALTPTPRDSLLLLAAAAAVLPDLLDRFVLRPLWRPDATLTPDPLAPEPAPLAQQFSELLRRAAAGSLTRIRVNPLRAPTGGCAALAIRLGPSRHEVHVSTPVGGASAGVVDAVTATPDAVLHVTEEDGLEIEARPGDPVRLQAARSRGGASHGPVALLCVILAGLWAAGPLGAWATATGFLSHLALDGCHRPGPALLAPLSDRRFPLRGARGRQTPALELLLVWMATATLLHGMEVLPTALWIPAGLALPLLAWRVRPALLR